MKVQGYLQGDLSAGKNKCRTDKKCGGKRWSYVQDLERLSPDFQVSEIGKTFCEFLGQTCSQLLIFPNKDI